MDQCLRSTTLLQPDQFGSTMIKEEPPSPGSDGTFLHSPCSEAPSVLSDADTSHLTEKDKAALEILMEDVPVSTDEYFDSGGYSTQSFQTNPSLEALNLAGEGIQIEEISHDECASISNVLNKVNEMNSYFTPPPPYPEAVPSRVPPYHTPYQCYPSYQEEYVNYDQIQDTTLRAMLQRRPNNAGYPPHVAISPPPAYGTGSPPLNCGNARKPTTEGAGSRRVSSDKENTTEDGRVRRRCSVSYQRYLLPNLNLKIKFRYHISQLHINIAMFHISC